MFHIAPSYKSLVHQEWEGFCAMAGRSSGDLSFPVVYCPEVRINDNGLE